MAYNAEINLNRNASQPRRLCQIKNGEKSSICSQKNNTVSIVRELKNTANLVTAY